MLRLAAERDEVRVVDDQRGCPTFAADLAAPTGTFHYVSEGEVSWAGFATAIFAASARAGGPSARVVPITTAEYPTPARRPANSRLLTTKIRDAFGIVPPPWCEPLNNYVAQLIQKHHVEVGVINGKQRIIRE